MDVAENNYLTYEDLEDDNLTADLKRKSKTHIKAYVAAKTEERKTIQEDIQNLNQKEEILIQQEQIDDDNGLKNVMLTP